MLRNIKSLALALAFTSAALASSISFPNGQTNSVSAECGNFAGYICSTSAYFDAKSLYDQVQGEGISSLFTSAFDAWNDGNAANSKWTLNSGGSLTGTFDIDPAAAGQFFGVVSVG